ncbi:MAG: cyclodeaminase/cyclohydrolase family protein [Ignavibacteriae bacterium]|nr:cyclodeaminase/cyclohydrolase family protein [Ignavibacteriota bacterium]
MLVEKSVIKFLDELASSSPAPGGGSVAALSGSLGAALTAMVCTLTIGKKKYAEHEIEMKNVLRQAEEKRKHFTALIDRDTAAFSKVMEAYALPKETDTQKALRTAAIQEATKEAALVPLEVMRHAIDTLALARIVAEKGNVNSSSDAGVSALMLYAAGESAALNVQINLSSITDTEFVGWQSEEVASLLRTSKAKADEILAIARGKIVS